MAKIIITENHRYEVEADDLRVALNNFHIIFDGVEPEMFEMEKKTLSQDAFVYLDGNVNAEIK